MRKTDAKTFFDKLEKFCKEKPDKVNADATKCHVCELLGFCYSPPADFKQNCDIDKVIEFVNGLKD